MTKNYIFGPLRSRRLGFSLGVDLVPYKTCSLDCPYCQLGRTTHKSIERCPYGSPDAIIAQLSHVLEEKQKIDYITLSGSGEPTLSSHLGTIISRIKELTAIPLAVLTNGTLLHQEAVRDELSLADVVVPSLDAVTEKVFRAVNQPHPLLTASQMLSGLEHFRKVYTGQLWLEIMLVKGINDGRDELERISEVVSSIAFDKVQLNTPVRPAADKTVEPLTAAELERIRDHMGSGCEVIAGSREKQHGVESGIEERIMTVLSRRPLNLPEIADSLGIPPGRVTKHLCHLEGQGRITSRHYGSELYYQAKRS